MIKSGHRRPAKSFNLCYRYINDLIIFSDKKFLDDLKEIYLSELTAEKANKSDLLAEYLDLTFIIDRGLTKPSGLSGSEWVGLGWSGSEWVGVGRSGLEWDGVGWSA